jgi:UDP-N-acetyl-D-glucosamine dehydrogenase
MASQNSTVVVIGLGYVGLPLSLAAKNAGWDVIGLDSNIEIVNKLQESLSHVEDVSNEQLSKALQDGFRIESDPKCIRAADIIIICVPTPIDLQGRPELKSLESAVEAIARYAKSETLVINESTSFPGTVREFIPGVVKKISPHLQLLYATAPERVDPGNQMWNYKNTPRIISGLTEAAGEKAHDFYSSFCHSVIRVSKPEVAELSKLLENSFRQVNIALVNELVPIAKSLNIDIFEVISAAASKPYGFMAFYPGVGVGGHCIPVDPMYLSWAAKKLGKESKLIDIAQEINDKMPEYVARRVINLNLPATSKVLIVGLSYKSGIADLRESPSVELFELLQIKIENLEWWDEKILEWKGKLRSELKGKFDLVIVTHKVSNSKVEDIIKRANMVIDCTGSYKGFPNIESF